ncbi:MAG: nucleotide sugar dehydrogenase [Candidatus Lokiarchaeota archaeon]|nr:nucleotide sugar dehydrogenase [Candidatus Lokiarchaeota archaeon]MBD3201421.1 nucleotide sugar dehydrogenase [Candidatus Lokiarchaeota archaeon]
MKKPKISIAGCGFVGLVNAAAFASRGYEVIATTINKEEADIINQGKTPFYEKGLDNLLAKAIKLNNLKVIEDNQQAVQNSDITFISVGTPMNEDKSIDLSYIEKVSEEIGNGLADKEEYHLIVDRSTIVPGTTRNIIGKSIEKMSGKNPGTDFGLCMQPEFLAEGRAVEDTFFPDRIIIGEFDEKSGDILYELYEDFYKKHLENCPILRMTLESAELVKYGNNCLLATKVSFANEFANIAELVENVDINQVMEGVGLDYRLNSKFLRAGAGFGGSCFPKDVNAIKSWAENDGYYPKILNAVLEINKDQAYHMIEIANELIDSFNNKTITILGLSFKPDTSDMREAPSVKIINKLLTEGVNKIKTYDPKAFHEAREIFEDKIAYCESIEEALKGSDCCFLVTEWDEFKNLKPSDFQKNMKDPNLIDGRRIYNFNEFSKNLNFRAIGRKALKK